MIRTSGEIAQFVGAELKGDSSLELSGVASPEHAGAGDLIYVDSPRHAGRAQASAALVVVAPAGVAVPGKVVLAARDPKLAFAKAAAWILKEPERNAVIHPTVIVSPSAQVGRNVSIGPYAVIEDDAKIGAGSTIGAFCFLGRGASLGPDCRLHPRVTLYSGVRLGSRVEVHSGVVIGSDGFGYVFGEGRQWKFPQAGGVEIGDDVEIGANTAIDRGSLETTRIANGVKIDNLVQIAHNVQIGEHSVVAAQTGVSGSSVIGKRVVVAGQVGIADHCHVDDGAVVGAQAGIPTGKTIRKGQTVWGTPARPLDRFKHQYAAFSRLPELAERVRRLEQER
ncbi:MAG TPA: UDP-3-O-(3-hydroxymyristoyl)glucosamine N-acyltransferase [Candidatus Acidoferrum sp.]|nr:UDP-3-O-(3-hydroxymyristoyl)glucosamine N-acyltransferase [Candidatus Acidoferrum sp.]